MKVMESAQTDFISVLNSMLLLVDYHPVMLTQVTSGDRRTIKDAAVASAKAASILNVPVVMTASEKNGDYIKEIRELFPKQEIIVRKSLASNALTDETLRIKLRKLGRVKLVIAGLWTSESFAETAIGAIKEGYDAFGLIDACGDTTIERHNYGVHRMLKAGLNPITWMSLASEWMNGWADPMENDFDDNIGKYNVMLTHLSRH